MLRTQMLCRPSLQQSENKDEVLEGKFSNLNFSPSTKTTTEYFSQVLNFTSVELNRFAKQSKLFFKKSPLFQKRRWSCDFPLRKTPVAQKHRAIDFPPRKHGILYPRQVVLGLPPSPRVCTGGWAYADVTPKFLRSIGYQICLAMVLRWRATRVGFANM